MTTMLPLARHSDSLWCRAQGSLATASYWKKDLSENYDARLWSEVCRAGLTENRRLQAIPTGMRGPTSGRIWREY